MTFFWNEICCFLLSSEIFYQKFLKDLVFKHELIFNVEFDLKNPHTDKNRVSSQSHTLFQPQNSQNQFKCCFLKTRLLTWHFQKLILQITCYFPETPLEKLLNNLMQLNNFYKKVFYVNFKTK